MKYLIVLLIMFTSCTDKENTNQESTTQKKLKSEKLQTNTDPLIASYDKGLDLILLIANLDDWYGDQIIMQTNPSRFDLESPWHYYNIYWLSNQNSYYYVTDPIETNNIKYSLDTNKQIEPSFSREHEYFDKEQTIPLLYIGSITPLERVYLNPSNKQVYLKSLLLIDDSSMLEYNSAQDEYLFIPISFSVYPKSNTYDVTYTNIQGDEFIRYIAVNWPLEYIGKLK